MVDAPQDEDDTHKASRRARNANYAQHRQDAAAHARNNSPHNISPCPRNLHEAFTEVGERMYTTPIGNITETTMLLLRLPLNEETQRVIQLTKQTMIQLDEQNPMPSQHRTHSRTASVAAEAPHTWRRA